MKTSLTLNPLLVNALFVLFAVFVAGLIGAAKTSEGFSDVDDKIKDLSKLADKLKRR